MCREFCSDCGTQLFFWYSEGPTDIDISIASLDDPSAMVPRYHIWTSSQLPWFKIADDLPCFVDDGSDFSPYKKEPRSLEKNQDENGADED